MKKNLLFSLFLFSTISILAGSWQQKTSIGIVGRHRALGISIGNKGYIGTGHYNGAGPNVVFNDWWEYDPSSNSWSQKANIPTPTYGSIGWGTDAKGYVGAGSIGGGIYYVYDPSVNLWSNTSPCPISASNLDCFMVNENGYVLGTNSLYEYNPTTDIWTQKTSCPSTINVWSSAFETASSGFVKTGFYLYEYKPLQDIWLPRAPFPGLTTGGGTAFQIHGKGYVASGYNGGLGNVNSEFWEFNPGTNVWTQMDDFPGTSRRFSSSFSINNRAYFGTGTNGTNFNDFWQYAYNPLSMDEFSLNSNNVKIYPNPIILDAKLSIDLNEFNKLDKPSLILCTISGENILEQRIISSESTIKRNEIKKGIYIYLIVNAHKVIFTGKLIYQ